MRGDFDDTKAGTEESGRGISQMREASAAVNERLFHKNRTIVTYSRLQTSWLLGHARQRRYAPMHAYVITMLESSGPARPSRYLTYQPESLYRLKYN